MLFWCCDRVDCAHGEQPLPIADGRRRQLNSEDLELYQLAVGKLDVKREALKQQQLLQPLSVMKTRPGA